MVYSSLFLYSSSLPQQRISSVSDLMAMIVVMVLITQKAFVGSADSVTAFIIVDGTEQALSAVSDLMAMLVIMVGVSAE